MDGRTAYTIKEFAKRNGMSAPTVRRRLREGNLPYFQPGGPRHRILIPHDALARSQPEYPALRHQQQPNQKSDAGTRLPGPQPAWMRNWGSLGPPSDTGEV
jgi:excisionase family DNA binding protein